MTLRPDEDDGPVEVQIKDEEFKQVYDRVFHHPSGMVTLYDVEKDEGNNRVSKGNRARTIPVRRIEEIEYNGFGK